MQRGKSSKTKHKPPKKKARRRSPSQICVSPSKGQQSKQRTGQEPNRNNHKRFAKDTVVKTHCVATDSKTCSKRISCHPIKWDPRSTLLPIRQQKVAFAIHRRLTQPLRVLSQVLVHVPMFSKKAGTKRRKQEQQRDAIGGQVSLVPSPLRGAALWLRNAVTQGQVSDHPSQATKTFSGASQGGHDYRAKSKGRTFQALSSMVST